MGESRRISLDFGRSGNFSIDVDAARVASAEPPVAALDDLPAALEAALAAPLEFPPLEQAVIPDDRVALAIDADAPGIPAMIAGVWKVLQTRGVAPDNVVIVQSKGPSGKVLPDPRSELPERVARRMSWKIHDPDNQNDCAYVASTASGDRVYLSRDVVEAEVAVALGQIAYDPLLGVRGTNSVLYPALSTRDALRRAQGQGHDELGPDDDRPLRQLMDEVGWLIGTQFTLQVIPSAGGGVAEVLAGASDAVLKRGRVRLARHWLRELEARPEIVVAAVDAGDCGWEDVGAALAAARSLVARGGRIIVLSDLASEPGAGIELIRAAESARDALRPLRKQSPDDLIPATQFAAAADWARVCLLSRLDPQVVEDLFLTPAENVEEVARLLEGDESVAFLPSAQHVFGRVKRGG